MKKDIFAIDMDDVTFNLKDSWAEKIHEDHGIFVDPKDWHTYKLPEVYKGLTDEDVLNSIVKHDLFRNIPLMPNVKEKLQEIQSEGIELVIVSARGWLYNAEEVTLEALSKHDIKVYDTYMVNYDKTKKDVLKEVSTTHNLVGFVDDNKDHIHKAATAEDFTIPNIFLQDQKWNHGYNHPDVKRIYDFSEIKIS